MVLVYVLTCIIVYWKAHLYNQTTLLGSLLEVVHVWETVWKGSFLHGNFSLKGDWGWLENYFSPENKQRCQWVTMRNRWEPRSRRQAGRHGELLSFRLRLFLLTDGWRRMVWSQCRLRLSPSALWWESACLVPWRRLQRAPTIAWGAALVLKHSLRSF